MTRAQRLAQDLAAVTPEDRDRVVACVLSVLQFFADLRSERSMTQHAAEGDNARG